MSVFLYLSMAFDTVSHEILLHKFPYYGIRGKKLDCFQNHPKNRKQYIAIDDITNDFLDIKCGVPQQSILGPVLVLIYMNNRVHYFTKYVHITWSADDMYLLP